MKKNPAAVAAAAIDSAKTTAIMSDLKAKGASDEELVKAILPPEALDDIARSIHFDIRQLLPMGWCALGLPRKYKVDGNMALLGRVHLMQHYTDTPEAVEYFRVYTTAKTVREVWEFFLKCNDLPDDVLVNKPGYDHDFVQNLLNQDIMGTNLSFGINQEDSERGPDPS